MTTEATQGSAQPTAGTSMLSGAPPADGTQGQAGPSDVSTAAAAGSEPTGQQTGQQQGAQGQGSADGGQPAVVAEFDPAQVKLPDGVKAVDAKLLEGFTPLAKELKLTQEQAQKFVDLHAGAVAQVQDSLVQAFESQTKQWADQVRADPEIGGDKLTETLHFAQKAVRMFGGDELAKTLDDLGIGNHPQLVKAFATIGRKISPDSMPAAGAPPAADKSPADVLFGGTKAA